MEMERIETEEMLRTASFVAIDISKFKTEDEYKLWLVRQIKQYYENKRQSLLSSNGVGSICNPCGINCEGKKIFVLFKLTLDSIERPQILFSTPS